MAITTQLDKLNQQWEVNSSFRLSRSHSRHWLLHRMLAVEKISKLQVHSIENDYDDDQASIITLTTIIFDNDF